MSENEIRVKTPIGDIVAVVGGDPKYPEIYSCIETKYGEIDLSVISFNPFTGDVNVYVRENLNDEDYSKSFTWPKHVIENAGQKGEFLL